MSSTNRGYDRHISDHYRTDKQVIRNFLTEFKKDVSESFHGFLDPCAGGDIEKKKDMPYPEVLKEFYKFSFIATIDIRENSPARNIKDYLQTYVDKKCFDVIITNPPFLQALEFIQKALEDVKPGGYVIMFLRLNFWGSGKRKEWLKANMPLYCYIHSDRPSFIDEPIHTGKFDKNSKEKILKPGDTDSIEYAHFVWRKGEYPEFTKTRLV